MQIQAFLPAVGLALGKQAHEPLPYLGLFYGLVVTAQAGPLMYAVPPPHDCPRAPVLETPDEVESPVPC